jgi:hypothetical protein
MLKPGIIKDVIFFPQNFHARGNISAYSLLMESGYFQFHNEVTEQDILQALGEHPECLNQWQTWSDNKRAGSGWYFAKEGNGKFVVDFFPSLKNIRPKEYENIAEACAAFIKLEIEDIRDPIQRKSL